MMQMRDWISGLVGAIIFLLGLLPLIGKFESLNNLPVSLLTWIVAGSGLYLAVNSIIEITNSNIVGWWSFGVAAVSIILGLLPLIPWFHFGVFSSAFYNVNLVIEGVFLMIATFAMEL